MSDYRIILVNGPPKSGKDTLANAFVKQTTHFGIIGQHRVWGNKEKFAYPLYWALAEFFSVTIEWLEEYKDEPVLPNGVTPRKALQDLSEVWAKNLFGQPVFGDLLAKRIKPTTKLPGNNFLRIYIVSDSGFQPEANAVHRVHQNKVGLIRLMRNGTSYSGDTRDYIVKSDDSMPFRTIENNGTVEELMKQVREFVEEVINHGAINSGTQS